MSLSDLLDVARIDIKRGDYRLAPATALNDPSLHPRVQEYRRQSGGRMYPLDPGDLQKRLPAAQYHVSRKIDGQFAVLVYQQGQAFTVNPGGTVHLGLPWQTEAATQLAQAGVQQALLAGELYVATSDDRRCRVHDVTSALRQPESQEVLERVAFAVFDLLSLNDAPAPDQFEETWTTIKQIVGDGKRFHPVEAQTATDASGVEKLFKQWVEQQGAEGVVVRSDTAGMFKIKPRHTLDAAVIGFTESTDERQGLLHDLLLAVMRDDGSFHVLCRVGGGFSEEQRRSMLADLKDVVVESEYAEVNSDHVAYQMVRPEWVVEISCLDLVSQTTRGGSINRMVLNWNAEQQRYEVIRRLPLASVVSPQFIRLREDKTVQPFDVRIHQIAGIVDVSMADRDARQMTLPKSEVLRREVYTKQLKGATMVRKFVMWKTNKETESEDFPAYVIHYTDFSPNRKIALQRDVRISNSQQQIEALWVDLKQRNVKKGWAAVESQKD